MGKKKGKLKASQRQKNKKIKRKASIAEKTRKEETKKILEIPKFWFALLCASITLVGNYELFLTTTSWVRVLVHSWHEVLHWFWLSLFMVFNIEIPRVISSTLSSFLFLFVYLKPTVVPKKLRKKYVSDDDSLLRSKRKSYKNKSFWMRLISVDFEAYIVLKGITYILLGMFLKVGSGNSLLLDIFVVAVVATSACAVVLLMYGAYLYRSKLTVRMLFILYGAVFLYLLSLVPLFQFDILAPPEV